MKSILCCALLILPAAHGAPRKPIGKPAVSPPPKARVISENQKTKLHVSVMGDGGADKTKSVQDAKPAVPKVVAARPVTKKEWRWIPRFQKSGKEDTTWGFMLKRPF